MQHSNFFNCQGITIWYKKHKKHWIQLHVKFANACAIMVILKIIITTHNITYFLISFLKLFVILKQILAKRGDSKLCWYCKSWFVQTNIHIFKTSFLKQKAVLWASVDVVLCTLDQSAVYTGLSPLCTLGSPLCTLVSPLCTLVSPLCTLVVSPLCTLVQSAVYTGQSAVYTGQSAVYTCRGRVSPPHQFFLVAYFFSKLILFGVQNENYAYGRKRGD